jgi:hypothetical protein
MHQHAFRCGLSCVFLKPVERTKTKLRQYNPTGRTDRPADGLSTSRNLPAPERLARPRQTLYEFIQGSPLRNVDIALPQRLPEKMREVRL